MTYFLHLNLYDKDFIWWNLFFFDIRSRALVSSQQCLGFGSFCVDFFIFSVHLWVFSLNLIDNFKWPTGMNIYILFILYLIKCSRCIIVHFSLFQVVPGHISSSARDAADELIKSIKIDEWHLTSLNVRLTLSCLQYSKVWHVIWTWQWLL